jgi:hypothetical protein
MNLRRGFYRRTGILVFCSLLPALACAWLIVHHDGGCCQGQESHSHGFSNCAHHMPGLPVGTVSANSISKTASLHLAVIQPRQWLLIYSIYKPPQA